MNSEIQNDETVQDAKKKLPVIHRGVCLFMLSGMSIWIVVVLIQFVGEIFSGKPQYLWWTFNSVLTVACYSYAIGLLVKQQKFFYWMSLLGFAFQFFGKLVLSHLFADFSGISETFVVMGVWYSIIVFWVFAYIFGRLYHKYLLIELEEKEQENECCLEQKENSA